MKKHSTILIYTSIGIIILGLILRNIGTPWNALIIFAGFLTIFIYIISSLIEHFRDKNFDIDLFFPKILLGLISIVLFIKYINITLMDFPGLVIIPIFILISIFYLSRMKRENININIITIFFLLLTIPLFGINFYLKPRLFLPFDLYDRYGDPSNVEVDLPYKFKNRTAEKLYDKAVELYKVEKYYESIPIFREALKHEPNNQMLFFSMSSAYAETNNLEIAMHLLDSAIMIDNYCAAFYNNRGLCYLKMNQAYNAIDDFKKAIDLDSTLYSSYYNLALSYELIDNREKTCETLIQAERLKLKIYNQNEFEELKSKYCR